MSISEFTYTVLLKPKPLRRLANAVLKALLPSTTRVNGATIFLNPSDPVISAALLFGVYEHWELDFFSCNYRSDTVFVDIGANVGLYTGLALSRSDSRSTVLCIEPHEESRVYLEQTIKENLRKDDPARVIVCPLAASDCGGKTTLYQNLENKGDNRLHADSLCEGRSVVETETLDSICARNGISRVDFLKMDVQGHEGLVLRGAAGVLSASDRCLLMFEFWPQGLSQSGSPPEQFLGDLDSMGFKLYAPKSGRMAPIDDLHDAIHKNPGRIYANLVALKGISPSDLHLP
jgi:FkbM family methyltransferase